MIRCGHLWATRATSICFGWHEMSKREKLLGWMFVIAAPAFGIAAEIEHKDYGIYQRWIDNVLFPTPISAKADDEVFPSKRHHSVGKDSGKTSYIELADSGGLTAPYANASLDPSGRHYPSPKSWRIISVQFGVFTTTIHPYLFSTTQNLSSMTSLPTSVRLLY